MNYDSIADGVWSTMITPFKRNGVIDYTALEKLIDWYVERGVSGLFAVCQSSEMFFLSLRERLDLARACVKFAAGRVPVIASGHVADNLDDQIYEAKAMAETGVQAVVLITNRLAKRYESDDVFMGNLDTFLRGVEDEVLLGFYECPYPYKRAMNPRLMRHSVDTGRFGFLKDTSCSRESIKTKLAVASGSNFKLFNANAATLLDSLKMGASGYSGVMTNFHADLYSALCRIWKSKPEEAQRLQDFLGFASTIENQHYPVNAMYALSLEGLPIELHSRRADVTSFTESMHLEIEQMMRISHEWSARYSADVKL